MKDPERYIRDLPVNVRCAVTGRRGVKVDASLRAEVNHEIFYFAGRHELERFQRDPLRWCGTLTDPATKKRFRPTRRSPGMVHQGRPYFFPDSSSLRTFRSMPDSLARRKGA